MYILGGIIISIAGGLILGYTLYLQNRELLNEHYTSVMIFTLVPTIAVMLIILIMHPFHLSDVAFFLTLSLFVAFATAIYFTSQSHEEDDEEVVEGETKTTKTKSAEQKLAEILDKNRKA